MSHSSNFDAVVVGSGPNGLAAAITLIKEGLSVKIIESEDTVGGGMRTLELTKPGFRHDICSAIHPMAVSSPFLRQLPLNKFGLEWIKPEFPLAHPLDDQPAVIQHPDINHMKDELGTDFDAYKKLYEPLVMNWDELAIDIMGPLSFPNHPIRLARFGLNALRSAKHLISRYKEERAKALFGGIAAHSILSLDKPATAAIGLVLGAAGHSVGWPLPKGGSQSIADAMKAYFESLGGVVETGLKITNLNMLPDNKAVLFDLTPKQVLSIAGDQFPQRYQKKLKNYRYGAGVFKIDYLLSEPVPWKDPRCRRAGTVHIGGAFSEIMESEASMSQNRHSEKPYILVAQQSLFDKTRTPDNRETLWAYCHVPNGSDKDMTQQIENQIERFAPGFRDVIEKRVSMTATSFESYNANYIGGDINGGSQDLFQLFARPVSLFAPYATPVEGLYFCSSSTPPGGGVHGMCGYHAAQLVLKREFKLKS
jgi:phytoene dehydrogenase-like protein